MMPTAPGPDDPAAARHDVHLALLTISYPAFTITRQHYASRRPRWEIIRKNPQEPGLYALITPDLAEARVILAANAQAYPPEPGPPP
jgi:hypothetical protein